jgi:hypothetical protein
MIFTISWRPTWNCKSDYLDTFAVLRIFLFSNKGAVLKVFFCHKAINHEACWQTGK